MTLQQLEHFSKQGQSPEVSNPGEAVQGRTRPVNDLDSFMKQDDKFRRENFNEMVKSYDRSATNKVKAN